MMVELKYGLQTMMLPNKRWLVLPLNVVTEDWYEILDRLDSYVELQGFQFSENSVYFLFDSLPSEILNGEGQCWIGRSYVGKVEEESEQFIALNNSLSKKPWSIDWDASDMSLMQVDPWKGSLVDLLLSVAHVIDSSSKGDKKKNLISNLPLNFQSNLSSDAKFNLKYILKLTRKIKSIENENFLAIDADVLIP